MEQQDGLDDQARVVALVEVESALEHDHGPTLKQPQEQPTDMAWGRGGGPAGQVGERDGDRVLKFVSQAAQTRTQDDANFRHESGPFANGGSERPDPGRLLRRRDVSARVLGSPHIGGERQIGHTGLQGSSSEGRRDPQASSARRKYRHRDAVRVPSGVSHAGGPW